jgi:ribosomal protein S18 acetylase RimI-like enzyme
MQPMSTPVATGPRSTAFRIAGFDPRWRADFARLNEEWLRRWFVVEAFDAEVLGNPETHILADGGRILFALADAAPDGPAVGTVALRHDGNGVYELTKMAVEPGLRGSGIGRALLLAAIDTYTALGGRELYLESSSLLAPALRLYESAGFVHRPAPRPGSHYARADVHMAWEPRA